MSHDVTEPPALFFPRAHLMHRLPWRRSLARHEIAVHVDAVVVTAPAAAVLPAAQAVHTPPADLKLHWHVRALHAPFSTLNELPMPAFLGRATLPSYLIEPSAMPLASRVAESVN